MKKLTILFCLIWCIICTIQAKDRVIERPPFITWSSTSIEVDKIVVSDTATVMYIKAFYIPNSWITIAAGSVLKDNNGKLYPVLRGIGITLNEKFQIPGSGEREFQLVFPPLPENVSSVDFSEGDFNGAFQIWGIQLHGKSTILSPKVISPQIDTKVPLPEPMFTYGKAVLSGKVLDFQKGMPNTGELYITSYITDVSNPLTININPDGTFRTEIEIPALSTARVYLPIFKEIEVYLAPGQETIVTLNTRELTRQLTRLHKKDQPYGEKVYHSGYLAGLQQELLQNKINTDLSKNYDQILKAAKNGNANELKDYFLHEYQNIIEQVNKASLSLATKEVLKINASLSVIEAICVSEMIIKRAYIISNGLDDKQAEEYSNKTTVHIPENYYEVVKDFSILNDNKILYATNGITSFHTFKELLQKVLGTNNNVLFNLMETQVLCRFILDFNPLSAEQKAKVTMLPPVYNEMLHKMNDRLLKNTETNRQKSGYKVNKVEDVSNEQLFNSIISNYSGHVLLVDFWATWCGPCRTANKAMLPMKEDLKDKDIVYLYITGETSPKGIWENMISDIHGEHFRVNEEQWSYLLKQFQFSGIPTYLIIDKQGNKVFQQTAFPGVDKMKEELMKASNK